MRGAEVKGARDAGEVGVASSELAKTLRPRHVDLITLGGIIGAGLFIGSSAGIATAGPAIAVSYASAGGLIFLIMRLLGELAIAKPGLGSFTDYVRLGLGNWAGFTSGWLYKAARKEVFAYFDKRGDFNPDPADGGAKTIFIGLPQPTTAEAWTEAYGDVRRPLDPLEGLPGIDVDEVRQTQLSRARPNFSPEDDA